MLYHLAEWTIGIPGIDSLQPIELAMPFRRAFPKGTERRIEAGVPVRTASTRRELTEDEVQLHHEYHRNQVQLCQEKATFLGAMQSRRQALLARYDQLYHQAPLEVAGCEMSRDILAGKVSF